MRQANGERGAAKPPQPQTVSDETTGGEENKWPGRKNPCTPSCHCSAYYSFSAVGVAEDGEIAGGRRPCRRGRWDTDPHRRPDFPEVVQRVRRILDQARSGKLPPERQSTSREIEEGDEEEEDEDDIGGAE